MDRAPMRHVADAFEDLHGLTQLPGLAAQRSSRRR
jgi:L-arabinose isomerase